RGGARHLREAAQGALPRALAVRALPSHADPRARELAAGGRVHLPHRHLAPPRSAPLPRGRRDPPGQAARRSAPRRTARLAGRGPHAALGGAAGEALRPPSRVSRRARDRLAARGVPGEPVRADPRHEADRLGQADPLGDRRALVAPRSQALPWRTARMRCLRDHADELLPPADGGERRADRGSALRALRAAATGDDAVVGEAVRRAWPGNAREKRRTAPEVCAGPAVTCTLPAS